MEGTYAVVIMYNGSEELSKERQDEIIAYLATRGIAKGFANVVTLNPTDIARKVVISGTEENVTVVNNEEDERIKEIDRLMHAFDSDFIKPSQGDNRRLASALLSALIVNKGKKVASEGQKTMNNIAWLIGCEDEQIPVNIKFKYHLTPDVIKTVKKVYNLAQTL